MSLIVIASRLVVARHSLVPPPFVVSRFNYASYNPRLGWPPRKHAKAMSSNNAPSSAQPHSAITAEENDATESPNRPQPAINTASQKRPNACTPASSRPTQQATSTYHTVTELMSHAKKPKSTSRPPDTPKKAAVSKPWDPRNGLGLYIENAAANPEGRVLEYDEDFVVITDKYPKAR